MSFFNKRKENEIKSPNVQAAISGLKDRVNETYELADMIDEAGRQSGQDLRLHDKIRAELAFYLMYLTAADDTIDQVEVDFINGVLSASFTKDDVAGIVSKLENLGDYFEQNVPESFATMSGFAVGQSGSETAQALGLQLVALYLDLGVALVSADGEQDPREKVRLVAYVNMLRESLGEIISIASDMVDVMAKHV